MRLAVFADVHGNLHAFDAMLDDLQQQGHYDKIWFLGDLAAFGTRPAECIRRLQSLIEAHDEGVVKWITGNTDRYIVTGKRTESSTVSEEEKFERFKRSIFERETTLDWTLQQLTWEDYQFLASRLGKELHTHVQDYGTIIGFHAIPGNDEPTSLKPDSTDEEAQDALLDRAGNLAIAGHTHERMDRQLDGWRVINPGSVGYSFTQYGMAEWASIMIEDGNLSLDLRSVPYDVDAMLADAETVDYPHPQRIKSLLNRARESRDNAEA